LGAHKQHTHHSEKAEERLHCVFKFFADVRLVQLLLDVLRDELVDGGHGARLWFRNSSVPELGARKNSFVLGRSGGEIRVMTVTE